MSEPFADEQELLTCLADSGMEPQSIAQFAESLRSGQIERGKRILSAHRSTLLRDVHAKQELLYCMDFVCRKLTERMRGAKHEPE